MISQKQIFRLVKTMVGSNDVVAVNMSLVRFTGSWPAGLMLSQLLYWSERSKIPGGWVCKCYSEWEEEILLSEYQVRTAAKHMEKTLAILETRVKKFNGTPKLQYRIKQDNFSVSFLKFLEGKEILPSNHLRVDPEETKGSKDTEETSGSLTETTETIAETTGCAAALPPEKKIEDNSGTGNAPAQPKEEKEKGCAQKEKEAPSHQAYVDAYYQWYLERFNSKPRLFESDYKALKNIRKHLTDEVNGNAERALQGWLYILTNWGKLEDFLQKQLKPAQIDSNMTNILAQIRTNPKNVTDHANYKPGTPAGKQISGQSRAEIEAHYS